MLSLLTLLALLALLPLLPLLALLALLTLLPLLSLLALLSLLTLLTLLSLLTLLTLLVTAQLAAIVARQLLHLLPKLFRLAPQQLLLPALVRGKLLALALLVGQFLLPLSQFFQLLHGLVDALLALVTGLRLPGVLVLILLGIEFQVEEPLKVARGAVPTTAAASAATALPAKRHLNIAPGGFGAQQVLQRFLFGRQSVLPTAGLQLVGRRTHGRNGVVHGVHEGLERIAGIFELAGLHALGKRLGLIAQLGLNLGQKAGILRRIFPGAARPFQLVPGSGNDLLLTVGYFLVGVLLIATSGGIISAACLLRLRVVLLERLGLDKEHVGVGRGPRAGGRGIKAHQVARLRLEVLEGNGRGAGGGFRALGLKHRDHLFRATVKGVMQLDVAQAEIVLGLDCDSHFLDGRRAEIATGPRNLHLGRIVLLRFDEVIFREADVFAAFHRGDVIHAVARDRDAGHQGVVGAAVQGQLRSVAQQQGSAGQRLVGLDGDIGGGPLHGAQIAAGILGHILHAGPRRVMIGDLNVLDGRQIDHVQLEGLRMNPAGFHVVFHGFRNARDHELVIGAAGLGAHFGLFPLRRAGILPKEPHGGRGEALEARMDGFVGAFAHGVVARRDRDVVKGRHAGLGQTAPKQRRAITQEARARHAKPDERSHGENGG